MVRLIFILFSTFSFSQTHFVEGVVSDDANKPLESANVIAKPLQEKSFLKFAIVDNKGRYRLDLDNDVKYEITVSYIGFFEETFVLEANSKVSTHDFKLKANREQLKEIVIKHKFQPIIIKKDTLLFDAKSFANGNERKMKELLEKLPGVEVDKNGIVTVQGKKVTKMLVEGKSFFGGGSKLAVENIPADAIDKIEVIDNFNEVGFMKKVSDSDDLAMNVKLKENKKKFIFGDVEAGAEIGTANNGFYLAHTSLFYFSSRTNISFIADMNNIGKRTFTFDDLLRFGGGVSSYLSGRKSLTNLYDFASDNTDVELSKSQFSAINFSQEIGSKVVVSGFGIFSKVFFRSLSESKNEYLENESTTFENQTRKNDVTNVLGIGNVKLDYTPNKEEKFFYNSQFQATNNKGKSLLNSETDNSISTFETYVNADNISVKQYIEWHKQYNKKHTNTFVVNQSYNDTKPQNVWINSQPFLVGILPIIDDSPYKIEQLKKLKNNFIDALYKDYWILNNYNHIYTNIGDNFESSNFSTSEAQLLSDGSINNFDSAGFGNRINYQLNDFYVGLEYKFKIGKWINKPGIYWHNYQLKTSQLEGNQLISKNLFQPQWDSEYEFNKSETLKFVYKLENLFPEVKQFADRYTMQAYNLIFRGNAVLENEHFHSSSLKYSKMNTYRGVMINGFLSFNKKVNTIRNEVEIDGINQFTTPIQSDHPETNYNFTGSFSKKIYRFELKLRTNLGWFNYFQNLNNVETLNSRNNQNIGLVFRTNYRKWPGFKVGYTKGFSQFEGLTKSNYQTDSFSSDLDVTFLKSWTFEAEYEGVKNTNSNSLSNFYDVFNVSLRYQKKNSPLRFEILVNNLMDNKIKSSYNFSDYMISQSYIYVLPRVFMLSLSYKI